MKKVMMILFVFVFVPSVILMAQDATTTKTDVKTEKLTVGAKATWDKMILDMGDVEFMVPKQAEFTLTNDGNEPLLITYAKASCGCTNLQYSQEPILPGKNTKISVTYNGSGNGDFRKTITVTTNADPNPTTLQIMGKVIKKEEQEKK